MAVKYPNDLPAGSPGFSNNNNGRVPLPPAGAGGTTPPASTTKGAAPVGLNSTQLQSGQELANIFGHIFGYDNIYKILQNATNEKFNSWDAQTRQTRDRYLGDMAAQQQGIIDNSRNIRQQAVRTGLSKGSNVAAEVMQQMASQQQGMGVQQEYRNVLNEISNQRASQQGADIYNAMAMQNDLSSQLGTMSVNNRANSVEELVARLSYNANIDSNNAMRDQTASNARTAQAQLDAQTGFLTALKASGVPETQAWTIVLSQDPKKAYDDWKKKNPTPGPTYNPNQNKSAVSISGPSSNFDEFFKNGGF